MIPPKAPNGNERINMMQEEQTNQSSPFSMLNGAALAYVGDAVYELAVRKYVILKGITRANKLHKTAVKYVSASGQAKAMLHWIGQDDYLTSDEIQVYKRGRNHKANTKAKNASIGEYRQATGFEALLGWLKLTNQQERLDELIESALKIIEEGTE